MLVYTFGFSSFVSVHTGVKCLNLFYRINLLSALCCHRNLQAAIGAYYDFESPNITAPCMSFVRDVTIGEGESVPPDTPFTKTWRIQNTGRSARITILM